MTLDTSTLLNVRAEWREDSEAMQHLGEQYVHRYRWAKEDRESFEDKTTGPFGGTLAKHVGTVLALAPDGKVLVLDEARKVLHVMSVDCLRVLP
jgi:hypothetical protein